MAKKSFLVLISLLWVHSAGAISACDWYYIQDTNLRLHGPADKRVTVESAPTLKMMEEKLRSFLKPVSDDPLLQHLHDLIKEDVRTTLDLLKKVETDGYPVSQLSALVERYNLILTFPYRFLAWIAAASDSGVSIQIGWVPESIADLKDRISARFNLNKNAIRFAENFKLQLGTQTKDVTQKTFLIESNTDDARNVDFFFQYEYTFKVGLDSLFNLFKDREAGKVIIGVSPTIRQDYDGQNGSAEHFTEHDYFHAFFQKYKDHKLFQSLGISNLDQARRWKLLSNQAFHNLLDEWVHIKDPALKAAVEALLYVNMHEQGNSYPTQVVADFHDASKKKIYSLYISSNLKSEESIDRRISAALEGRVDEMIEEGKKWILTRAERDSTELLALLSQIL